MLSQPSLAMVLMACQKPVSIWPNRPFGTCAARNHAKRRRELRLVDVRSAASRSANSSPVTAGGGGGAHRSSPQYAQIMDRLTAIKDPVTGNVPATTSKMTNAEAEKVAKLIFELFLAIAEVERGARA